VLVGAVLWVATDLSGLHPTIAGMLAGLLIAAYTPYRHKVERAASAARAFRQSPLPSTARETRRWVARAISLNERLQNALHPWTGYVIVPLFALANAGVDLGGGMLGDALASPLTWAVVIGLVAGKTIGIASGALGALRLRLGALPQGVGEGQIVGGAALSGIGFTVSLLIVGLAFDSGARQDEARVGVLLAAAIALVVGWVAFKLAAVLRGEVSAGLPTVLVPAVDVERDHVAKRPDAPLTLVEFGDFECPFCLRATGAVNELRERFGDELRYVWRHLPLTDVHPHAQLAAEAAEAAGEQGRFWEMHRLLFSHQDQLELPDLLGYAGQLGLDVEEFARALEEGRHTDRVLEDVASAEASGARGTPTFFIGDVRHTGAYDAATLAAALEASRDRDGS
jgi:protein-disulfide isomerase